MCANYATSMHAKQAKQKKHSQGAQIHPITFGAYKNWIKGQLFAIVTGNLSKHEET